MAKILIVGNSESPLEQERGRVGQRAGHQIFWFSPQQASLPGVTHFTMPSMIHRSPLIRALLKPVFLHLALQKVQPDIVHVHYAQTGLMIFQLMRIHPLVVTVMGGDILSDQGYHGLSAFFVRTLLKNADCITSKSDFMDSTLNKMGICKDKLKRITWGVDLTRFSPVQDVSALRARWLIPSADLVLFDSRLARPFYNKHMILESFASYLREGGFSATLLISEAFADPAYLVQLREQARNLGINDKVRFVGAIPYNEMPAYYALADITVSVPPSDGLPHTIYEAYASGSFLILGNLPQYAGVVQDKVTAYLVPIGNVQALKEAIFWVSSNPEIRQKAKIIGRTYVQEHADFNTQAELVNEIYNGLLGANRGKQ